MKKHLIQVALALFSGSLFSQVNINEVQPSNIATILNPTTGKSSDWVELYNSGTETVDISGYSFNNKFTPKPGFTIPDETSIAAGEYLLLWADGAGIPASLQLNLKLDSDKEYLVMFDNAGEVVDWIGFANVPEDQTIGRDPSMSGTWKQFIVPTPGIANTGTMAKMQLPEVKFSTNGGFYPTTIELNLHAPCQGLDIRYTTDGSQPTLYSTKYSTPITIDQNTVVKAKVFTTAYTESRLTANSYFINELASSFPVVSLSVDPFEFFDEQTGMYSLGPYAERSMPNYGANFWEDRELPVNFEYFVDGKQEVEVNAGIKIFGGWSRRFPQRSVSINCRPEYGSERMRYQFFEDKSNDVYKEILLRNSGCETNSLKYRDRLLQDLVKDQMDIDYQAGQEAIVYINGEYWGIMNIREKLSERYLRDNYGLQDDEVDLLANYWEVKHGSEDEFWDMYDKIDAANLSSVSQYESISQLMDINEYLNYIITQIYIGNHDWPGGNIRYWKSDGGKWRWILFDTDQSFAYYQECNEDVNTLADVTSARPTYWSNTEQGTLFMRRLFANETFKAMFIQRMALHMNTTFATDRVVKSIEDYDQLYSTEKARHLERWGHDDSLWNAAYDDMIQFAQKRPAKMKGFVKTKFGLSGYAQLSITAENNPMPIYDIYGAKLYGTDITGDYFKDVPIMITADTKYGETFKQWEDANGNVLSTTPELELTLTGNMTIKAVYKTGSGLSNVYINELMAANSSLENGDDWIELYNGNSFSINIAGLYITDDLNSQMLWQIPEGNQETVIPANGYLVLWANGDSKDSPANVNFKLSKDGEQVGLSVKQGTGAAWVDSLSFPAQETDISFGRIYDGAPAIQTLAEATLGASNGLTSTVDEDDQASANVYPTINHGTFYVYKDTDTKARLRVIGATGQVVFSGILNSTENTVELSAELTGRFTVQIQEGYKTSNHTIIIQ